MLSAIDYLISVGPTVDRPPLCVDLDGTLVRSDTLLESALSLLKRPVELVRGLLALSKGKASMKRSIGAAADIDVGLLPYNDELLNFLRLEAQSGRRLILATGADISIADKVARHLQIFDTVLASDGTNNLTGEAKRRAIESALSGKPFTYAGNDRRDLDVWRHAKSAIVVGASRSLVTAAAKETKIEAVIANDASQWRLLLKAMRPYQWCKNLLVFVPIVTAQQIGNINAWLTAATMFFAFCLAASGTYLINDLRDLAADREHPRKRWRPFASGLLPLHVGMIAAPLLIAAALGASFLCGAPQILMIYLCLSLAYAFWLKARPLTDIFVLAALYTLRLFGGGAATGFRVSLWLLAFSSFQFLSLAVVKRVSELSAKSAVGRSKEGAPDGQIVGRGYFLSDADILQHIGIAAGFSASLVLALYVQAELSPGLDRTPTLAWAVVPLMLFWECRIWLATARGHMHDDPILYAFRDKVSWLVGLCAVAALLFGNHVSL